MIQPNSPNPRLLPLGLPRPVLRPADPHQGRHNGQHDQQCSQAKTHGVLIPHVRSDHLQAAQPPRQTHRDPGRIPEPVEHRELPPAVLHGLIVTGKIVKTRRADMACRLHLLSAAQAVAKLPIAPSKLWFLVESVMTYAVYFASVVLIWSLGRQVAREHKRRRARQLLDIAKARKTHPPAWCE